MEYHTAYFWQESERNLSSLALQQVYHKRKKRPIVFACVGRSSTTAMSILLEWFYGHGLQQCTKRGERGIYYVGKSIRRQLIASHITTPLVGVLGVGRRLCIFYVGETSVRVLNFQREGACNKELKLEADGRYGVGIQYVLLEAEVGVLLGTDGFWEGISEECVEEYLNVKELDGRIRTGRRFQELAKRGEQRGGTQMAAVLLVTK